MKIIAVFFFFIAAAERISFTFRRKEPEGKIRYKCLSNVVIFTYLSSVTFALIEFIIFKKRLNIFVSLTGVAIAILGILLRRISIKKLGEYWSIHIKEVIGHKLIKDGPYRYIRHPYYLAVMLELVGIALYFNAFFAMSFILIVHFPLLLVRIHFEEKVLISQFGREYLYYKKTTGIFLPKIRILAK